jgi:hypothetical protein
MLLLLWLLLHDLAERWTRRRTQFRVGKTVPLLADEERSVAINVAIELAHRRALPPSVRPQAADRPLARRSAALAPSRAAPSRRQRAFCRLEYRPRDAAQWALADADSAARTKKAEERASSADVASARRTARSNESDDAPDQVARAASSRPVPTHDSDAATGGSEGGTKRSPTEPAPRGSGRARIPPGMPHAPLRRARGRKCHASVAPFLTSRLSALALACRRRSRASTLTALD